MSKMRNFLIGVLALSAQATLGQPLPEGIRLLEDMGCAGTGVCLDDSNLFLIDTSIQHVGISSAVKYTDGRSLSAASDDLIGYMIKEDALAIFPGGPFYGFSDYTVEGIFPMGGLKVAGIEVANLNARWYNSALVCSQSEEAPLFIKEINASEVTAAWDVYQGNENCLQSGPLVYSTGTNAEKLRENITAQYRDFWDSEVTQQVLVQFTDANIGFLHAEAAKLSDINQALAELEIDGVRATSAVNLNGGIWSGYIVRTEGSPLAAGNVKQAYPSAFVVRRLED